ncbi:uncharacterized protein FYW35_002798 [Pterocles gutturalis]
MPEKSSSKLSVQHGGSGDANLAVHVQPEELCLKVGEEVDRQALGLVSHSITDSQQSTENLVSEKGTLCATNPPFNLEGSQSDIRGNASITQICTREEQIKPSHENIYPIAINASEKSVLVDTGNDTLSSIPFGVANTSEIHKDLAATLASEVIEAPKGSEVILKSKGTGEVKALDTALESETMDVLKYSEASLQSVAQGKAKKLEAASESVSLTSDVTAVPKSADQADLNTVKVAHMSVAMEEVKIPEASEKSLHMGHVKNVERSLELGGVSRTLEPALRPSIISDNLRVMQCSPVEGSSVLKAHGPLKHCFQIAAATAVSQVHLGPGAVAKVKDIEPTRSSACMTSAKALEETLQPIAVVKPKTLETMEPVGVIAKDVKAAQECLQAEVVKDVEGTTDPATALNASGVLLQRKVLTETKSVDGNQESALPAELIDVNVVAEAKGLRATLEPVAVVQTFVPQTTPEIQMMEGFKGQRAPMEVAALPGVKGQETSQATLQLENTNASNISESILKRVAVTEAKDSEGTSLLRQPKELRESRSESELIVRGLEAAPLSLQKEDIRGPGGVLSQVAVVEAKPLKTASLSLQMEGVKASEESVHCGTAARGLGAALDSTAMKVVRPVKSLGTAIGHIAETERKDSQADLDRAGTEIKMSSSHLHMKGARDLGDPASVGTAKIQALEAVLQPGTLGVARGLGGNVCSEAKMGSKVLEASPGLLALEERSQRTRESLAACVTMGPVRESETLAGMMHLKTMAEGEPKHAETVAGPVGASKTESSIISQSEVMTCARTSQTEVLGEITDSELATSYATVEVRGLDSLSEAEAVVEARSKTSHLTQLKDVEMVVGSETKSLMQGLGRTLASEVVRESRHSEVAPEDPNKAEARSKEAILEPVQTAVVQTLETSSKYVQGHSEAKQ